MLSENELNKPTQLQHLCSLSENETHGFCVSCFVCGTNTILRKHCI